MKNYKIAKHFGQRNYPGWWYPRQGFADISMFGRHVLYIGDNPPRRLRYERARMAHIPPARRKSPATCLWRL